VAFATETLNVAKKQLALQAIPEMDVLKAEADLATRQQDLTTARTNLELQELYMKNAVTRSLDDPVLQEMPVVPVDHAVAQAEPDTRPAQEMIAEALKERTELLESSLVLENSELSRRRRAMRCCPRFQCTDFMRARAIPAPRIHWTALGPTRRRDSVGRWTMPSIILLLNTRWDFN